MMVPGKANETDFSTQSDVDSITLVQLPWGSVLEGVYRNAEVQKR